MTDPSSPAGCLMCDLEHADDTTVVFRDEHWAAEIVPGYDVPGWLILRARRHAERITGLGPAELASFGPRAQDVIAAVTEVTGAPTTYLMSFGENHAHFHALIAARGADVPVELRGGNILALRRDHTDLAAAAALVPALRAAYQRRTRAATAAAGSGT